MVAMAAFLSPSAAQSNGRFPSAGQVEVDPANPAHLALRATYGLVVTADGGERWEWVCEEAMSYAGIWDPPIGIVKGGGVLAGLPDGLIVSSPDACGWDRKGPLEGLFVADLSVDKKNPTRAVVLTSTPMGASFDSRLFLTDDAGVSFSQVGDALPANFRALTVDLAPSDPSVVYVSGVLGGAAPMGAVLRSMDGGKTWGSFPVPSSDEMHAPFLGAVDPSNASIVYVRLDGAPGRLLQSSDGGASFQDIFLGEGALYAFALSPDGKTLLVGGEKDGLWRSPTESFAFEQTSTVRARCLKWADAGVYVCGEPALDGFSVGFSVTEGSTFSPFSKLADLCGLPSCGVASATYKACSSRWPIMKTTLGAKGCEASTGAGGAGGTGGASGTGGAGGATQNNPDAKGGGCHCDLNGSPSNREGLVTLLVASGLATQWRRSSRRKR